MDISTAENQLTPSKAGTDTTSLSSPSSSLLFHAADLDRSTGPPTVEDRHNVLPALLSSTAYPGSRNEPLRTNGGIGVTIGHERDVPSPTICGATEHTASVATTDITCSTDTSLKTCTGSPLDTPQITTAPELQVVSLTTNLRVASPTTIPQVNASPATVAQAGTSTGTTDTGSQPSTLPMATGTVPVTNLLEQDVPELATPSSAGRLGHAPVASIAPAERDTSPASIALQPGRSLSSVDLNTYAGRNPDRPVIPPRTSKKGKVDKMTKSLKKEARDREHRALMEAVQECMMRREKEIEELAEAHDKTQQYIRRLLNDETHYGQKREVNLFNAKIHWKSCDLNADCSPGRRAKMLEILRAIEEDPTMGDDMSDKRKEELLDALRKHRDLKSKGVRIDNRAASHDYQHTISQMNQEVSSMCLRTGAIGFALFTRGHINDTIFASWTTADGAEEFISETLGMTLGELGRKFDAWAVAQSQNEEEKPDNILTLQAECAKSISEGLREKLNKPTAAMSYVNYNTDIQLAYHVRLRGWPKDVKFAPPSTIGAKGHVRLLLDALRDGECVWVSMSAEEVKSMKDSLKEGGVQKKVRATRKDKGGTHKVQNGKRKKNNENADPTSDGRPAKRSKGKGGKKAQLPPQRPATPLFGEASDTDNSDV